MAAKNKAVPAAKSKHTKAPTNPRAARPQEAATAEPEVFLPPGSSDPAEETRADPPMPDVAEEAEADPPVLNVVEKEAADADAEEAAATPNNDAEILTESSVSDVTQTSNADDNEHLQRGHEYYIRMICAPNCSAWSMRNWASLEARRNRNIVEVVNRDTGHVAYRFDGRTNSEKESDFLDGEQTLGVRRRVIAPRTPKPPSVPRKGSSRAVVELMCRPEGATKAEMVSVTGWGFGMAFLQRLAHTYKKTLTENNGRYTMT